MNKVNKFDKQDEKYKLHKLFMEYNNRIEKYTLTLIVFFLISCDSNRLYEKNISIKNSIWELSEKPSFEFNNIDTVAKINLKINVRHSSLYPFSNLWLFINTINPYGELNIDTLECVLAKKDGKWIGHGLGDIWDVQCDFKNYRLDKEGVYIFEIEQAMRYGDLAKIEKLKGVMGIGLRIEKIK